MCRIPSTGFLHTTLNPTGPADDFVQVIYHNNRVVLALFSLRFPGPVQPVLDACRAMCVTTANLAISWPVDQDDPLDISKWPLAYASNFSIVNIAYVRKSHLDAATGQHTHLFLHRESRCCSKWILAGHFLIEKY